MCKSGVEIDEHGNLVHERSGEILKIWCEDNSFTGSGHFIEPSHPIEKKKKTKKKEKITHYKKNPCDKRKITKDNCEWFLRDVTCVKCKDKNNWNKASEDLINILKKYNTLSTMDFENILSEIGWGKIKKEKKNESLKKPYSKDDVFVLCKNIFKKDKTPAYTYDKRNSDKDKLGKYAKNGQRWLTPSEMVLNFVKDNFPDRERELWQFLDETENGGN